MKYQGKTKDHPLIKKSEIQQLLAQTEQYKNLASYVLELLNQTESRTDIIKDILFLIKVSTGFEAVGIRLREGEDFPYYETIGFSKEFVEAERYLCSRGGNGEVLRDSKRNPYLECMCGTIINGRSDPSLPFFTEGGSFWTNSTTALLASTKEEDRQSRTRNRCNGEGYESVALIPIQYDNKNIGLLQLNDTRKNLFTSTLISFFEDFVSSVGIAIKMKEREGAIFQPIANLDNVNEASISYREESPGYCKFFQNSPVGFLAEDYSDIKHCFDNIEKGKEDIREYFMRHPETVLSFAQKARVVSVNKAALKMLNVKRKEELYKGRNAIFNKYSFDVFREKLIALAQGRTEFNSEPVHLMLNGEEKNIYFKIVVPPGYEETLSRVFVYIIDVSDLKRQEELLKGSEEKYRKIVETSHDAMILADMKTGIIIDSNKKLGELLELAKHEIPGTHFSELHPKEAEEDYAMLFRSPVKEGIRIPRTLFACRKCNKNIAVSVNSGVITLKGEKYILATVRELTDTVSRENAALKSSRFKKPATLSFVEGDMLSQREREILTLIASGKSAKQMAKQMYISETTVRTHRMRIMQKLNMHKTADLVRYAIQSRLLD